MKKKAPLSPGQKKLEALGVSFPSLPLTLVGPLPKHDDLKELRYRVSKKVQQASDLERKEKLSIDLWIREQEKLGINAFVEGGMTRNDMITHFAERIDGFVPGGFTRCFGNSYYHRPIIAQKLAWRGPITADAWHYTQRLTHKPLKAIVTGPYTLMDWSYNEHYTSREAACRDLTAIIRKEIATLVERGARIIQIDEPAFTARPEEYTMFADALKEITRGFNVYFTLHHVYGDLTSYWTKMQSLPVDNFSLDATNSALTIWPLIKKTPPKKDVTVGIVTSESESAEAPRQWLDRARAALKVIPKNQIWFSCNAGLQSHSPDAAILKLRALCDTVKKLRG